MFNNYVKIAFRSIQRNFTYAFINIVGLAIGLASCLMIVFYVQHELSYDTFHPDSERLYRVGYEVSLGSDSKVIASSPYRLAAALKNDFTQLKKVTHFSRLYTTQVRSGDKIFRESGIAFADSNFFDLFHFKTLSGNSETVLNEPNQVVITDKIAKKYFGNTNPIGNILEIGAPYSDDEMVLTVAGVIEEMPSNTHFHMNFLVSMPTGQTVFSDNLRYNWGWDSHYTYVVLSEGYGREQFKAGLIDFGDKYIDGQWFIKFFAQKVEDIHLYSNLNSEIEANGSITYVYIFISVALIILLIACINYMNLATARAAERAHEVGVRKSVGANRSQLIIQFLGESVLTVSISMLIAIGFFELAMPVFNELAGKSIEINLFSGSYIFVLFVSVSLAIGILAGVYPAFFLSSFKPVKVLKETVTKVDKGALFLRKGLVTTQFTISIVLIVGTIIVYNQLDFLRSKDIGADTDNVILIPVQTSAIPNNFSTIQSELLKHTGIKEITTSNRRFGWNINSGTFYSTVNDDGNQTTSRMSNVWVGWDFFDFYKINIQHGRAFSHDYPADTTNNAVIINREAARVLELKPDNAVGKKLSAGQHFTGNIVGVADNFHFEALYNRIKPMVFILNPNFISFVSVKVSNESLNETMDYMRNVWNRFEPDRIFISSILNDSLYRLYVAEERFMRVFTIFTLLAIFTACLGVFGLAKFSTSRRIKEIGIRKALGATVRDIVKLFSSETIKLVGIAFMVAIPIAYLIMQKWLQQYAYKTTLDIWIFITAGIVTGVVAWVAVSWQALKASRVNPVDSLRNE